MRNSFVWVSPSWFSPAVISVSTALSCSPPLFLHYHPINRPSLSREARRQSAGTHIRAHHLTAISTSPCMSHALHLIQNLLDNTAANDHKTFSIPFLSFLNWYSPSIPFSDLFLFISLFPIIFQLVVIHTFIHIFLRSTLSAGR